MCFYWIVQNSRSFSIVIIEQATESLPFCQLAICRVIVGRLDQLTVKALMRALYVVMSHVLADELSQVRLASSSVSFPCHRLWNLRRLALGTPEGVMPAQPGQMLSHYRLVEMIGEDGRRGLRQATPKPDRDVGPERVCHIPS